MKTAEAKTSTGHAPLHGQQSTPFFQPEESRSFFGGNQASDLAFFKPGAENFIQRQPVDAGVSPLPAQDGGIPDQPVDAGGLGTHGVPDPMEQQRVQAREDIGLTARTLSDMQWYDLDAHPAHKVELMSQVFDVIWGLLQELSNFNTRIANASTLEEIQTIRGEVAAFGYDRQLTTRIQISRLVEQFRQKERTWFVEFILHDLISKDPVSFNRSAQKAALEFFPGFGSLIKVITLVGYQWQRTAAAQAAPLADWTEAEKTAFKTGFQRQLNTVWNSQNQASAPFKVSEPQDYLLKNDPFKWSDLNAHMTGEVQDVNDAASPGSGKPAHFTITVIKRTAAEANLRAAVSDGAATFYTGNETAGYDGAGNSTGQHTLAHEWMHMIGQPDEYAENVQSQSQAWVTANAQGTETGLGSDQWATCQQILQDRAAGANGESLAEQQQAQNDLNNLSNQYGDADAVMPGNQYNLYNVSQNAPDECFAIRGHWSGAGSTRLRPGAISRRGGTRISQNQADEQRLSDEGNIVRPYHREGVLVETNALLKETLEPDVQLEHNIPVNNLAERLELQEVRINNLLRDLGWL